MLKVHESPPETVTRYGGRSALAAVSICGEYPAVGGEQKAKFKLPHRCMGQQAEAGYTCALTCLSPEAETSMSEVC